MKSIILLVFVISLFNACKPVSLDDEEGKTKADRAKGRENFELPDLKDISGKEVVKKAIKEDCTKYRNSASFSIFGDISPFKQLQKLLSQGH